MKKLLIPILAVTAWLMIACGNGKALDNQPALEYLASVVKAETDTITCYLTDYLPAFGDVDSLKGNYGIIALPGEQGKWDIFTLVTSSMEGLLATVDIWQGGTKTTLAVTKPSKNSLRHDVPHLYTMGTDDHKITIGYTSQPAKIVAMWQNMLIDNDAIRIEDGKIEVTIPKYSSELERSFIRVYAADGASVFSDILVPLKNGKVVSTTSQLDRKDPHRQIIYSLMVDRFYNGNPDNDWKIDSPDVLPQVDYQGGDIKGITKKIKDGFFNDLGITTVWISPITQNPYDAWGLNEDPYTKFTGYHGYWPIYSTKIDDRFGTDEEFRELLDVAHEHGLNVILDYVANHLHIDSPVLRENPDWTTPLELPDGRLNLELWDEQRLTTWFDKHIPTLDMEREEIYQPMTDSALFWIANFDLDGFRHDATKHIPEVYWRTLTSKMRDRFPGRSLYQIGETYGSPQLIGSYVKSGMLDAQFDFNVYDRATWNIADKKGDMRSIASVVRESVNFYGYHNLMGYITGNHDRPRYISLAGGALTFEEDSKKAGWTREITVGDPSSYDKLALLEALMMTIPGIPCVYQGDEYGVPGGNDPDNRHMMQFEGYNHKEQKQVGIFKKLTSLRLEYLPLIYGDFIPVYDDKDLFVFTRIYMGEPIVVILNRGDRKTETMITLPSGPDYSLLSPQFSNGTIEINETEATLTIPALSFEIFTLK